MADNYQLFSAELDIQSREEYEFFKKIFNLDLASMFKGLDEQAKNAKLAELSDQFDIDFDDSDVEYKFPNFQYELSETSLWVYSEDYGDISQIGKIMISFFKKHRNNGVFYLTYSNTCSKPRIGEFGGGALFVTMHGMKHFNVDEFITQQLVEHQESLDNQ
jgi:hypothetical protein